MYRLDYDLFVKLCVMIEPTVIMQDMQKKGSCNPWGPGKQITTEIALHCLLQEWLAGGSYLDLWLSAGISAPSFYKIVHLCMDAILLFCPQLVVAFPSTDAELSAASMAFRPISTNGILNDGCVGCIDGMLIKIQTRPFKFHGWKRQVLFKKSYQTYGINVQAARDAKCRFISVCVAAPGGTNEIAAFRECPLFEQVQRLPIANYITLQSMSA